MYTCSLFGTLCFHIQYTHTHTHTHTHHVVFQGLRDLVTKDSTLFLKDPSVTEEEKFGLLEGELARREVGAEATGRMLKKLIDDRKFSILPDVIDNFAKLMRAKRGELVALVTSADKLTKAQTTSLQKGLEAQFDGKKVIIKAEVRKHFHLLCTPFLQTRSPRASLNHT